MCFKLLQAINKKIESPLIHFMKSTYFKSKFNKDNIKQNRKL